MAQNTEPITMSSKDKHDNNQTNKKSKIPPQPKQRRTIDMQIAEREDVPVSALGR